MEIWKDGQQGVAKCFKLKRNNEISFYTAKIDFEDYFVGLGDDKSSAISKVEQLLGESSDKIYLFMIGIKQPLIDSINSSVLVFMDSGAKTRITTKLNL